MTKKFLTNLVILVGVLWFSPSVARGVEVFGKASLSKSNLSRSEYVSSFSGSAGLAVTLFSTVKLEGRYIFRYDVRNLLTYDASTYITDLKTSKNIYTVGLSIDIVSDRHAVQPYIYLGGGYIKSTSNYNYTSSGVSNPGSVSSTEPSANGGLGFRIRIGKSVAFEIEAFAYTTDIDKPNPLIDWFGSAGLRFFL